MQNAVSEQLSSSSKSYQSAILAFVLLWVVVFFDTLDSMVQIWIRSETFTHGFIIFPLSLWLIYDNRAHLRNVPVSGSSFALLPFAASLLLWMFAVTADIDVIAQFMCITTLMSGVWALSGWTLVRKILFPLCYLLFAVPVGENLIPALQDVTAWISVKALNLHGIPVYRDGLYLMIPSGLFEVAEACSGIRYLIASFAIGTVFAYMNFVTLWKQITFGVFSILLPILANGIRAYLIIIIAHYSDMEYATGADHLIYGWVFFGFVMFLMMYIGNLFAEDRQAPSEEESEAQSDQTVTGKYKLVGTSVLVLMLAGWVGPAWVVSVTTPEEPPVALKTTDTFKPVSQERDWEISFEYPLQASQLASPDGIEFFRAVYAHKQSAGEMISSTNKLFITDNWTLVDQDSVSIGNGKARFVYLTNAYGHKRGLLYWYELDGQALTSKLKMKLTQAWLAFTNSQTKAEINAISARAQGSRDEIKARLLEQVDTLGSMKVVIADE